MSARLGLELALAVAFVLSVFGEITARTSLDKTRDQFWQCIEVGTKAVDMVQECRQTLADCINANSELTAPMPEPQSMEVPHGA